MIIITHCHLPMSSFYTVLSLVHIPNTNVSNFFPTVNTVDGKSPEAYYLKIFMICIIVSFIPSTLGVYVVVDSGDRPCRKTNNVFAIHRAQYCSFFFRKNSSTIFVWSGDLLRSTSTIRNPDIGTERTMSVHVACELTA